MSPSEQWQVQPTGIHILSFISVACALVTDVIVKSFNVGLWSASKQFKNKLSPNVVHIGKLTDDKLMHSWNVLFPICCNFGNSTSLSLPHFKNVLLPVILVKFGALIRAMPVSNAVVYYENVA